jgi:hypothetical protein
VARRALTLLSYHPRVNRERLGIFGVSIGGTLCWLVAAMDDRVKTTVAIYGCGHTFDKRKTAWGFPENEPGLSLFNRVLAPEAHARQIHRSVLLLDATNDFHGWMDHAYETLADVDGPSRLAFTPRHNHHIDEAQGRDLPAWMDWQLRDGPRFPAAPKVTLRLNQQGDPLAEVRPADESQVSRVEVFYALGEKPPPNRFWRRPMTLRSKQSWEAQLPVLNARDPILAFANVSYRSGVCLSTKLARTIPGRLGSARASLTWSDSPSADPNETGSPFVYALANTDPNVSPAYFIASRDADRPAAVCVNPAIFGPPINFAIISHYVGDPGYKGRDGDSLCFEYQGNFLADSESKRSEAATINRGEAGFSVQLTAHDWTPQAKSFTARIAAASSAGWREVKLPAASFVAADGRPLPSWNELDKIEIRGVASKENPPCFARFHWSCR